MKNSYQTAISTCRKILTRKKPAKRDQVLAALQKLEKTAPLICFQGMCSFEQWRV